MSSKLRIIVAVMVVAIAAAAVVWKYTFRKSASTVSNRVVEMEVQAADLAAAFETNEDSANASYLGKVVSVTGIVAEVSADSSGVTVYLRAPENLSGVACSFDPAEKDAALLQAGSLVTIRGLCTGYLMDVVLTRCLVEQAADKPIE